MKKIGRPSKRDKINDLIWDLIDEIEARKPEAEKEPEIEAAPVKETEKDLFDVLEANTSGLFHEEKPVFEEPVVEIEAHADYTTEEIGKMGSFDALEKWAEEHADEKCFNAPIYRSIGTKYGYYIILPRIGNSDDYEEKKYIHHFCGINGLGLEVWYCHNEEDADMFYMDAYYREMKGGN